MRAARRPDDPVARRHPRRLPTARPDFLQELSVLDIVFVLAVLAAFALVGVIARGVEKL